MLPWCSGVCRTNFGILLELFGGESWSKSIKRSDSVGLVRVEIAIASLLLEDEDDMVWKKLQKIKGGLCWECIFNLVHSLTVIGMTILKDSINWAECQNNQIDVNFHLQKVWKVAIKN